MDLPPLFTQDDDFSNVAAPKPEPAAQDIDVTVVDQSGHGATAEAPPPPHGSPVDTAQLLKSVQDLLKNPLVLAGGALVAGIALSRITGRVSRNGNADWLINLVKEKITGQHTPPQASQPPPQAQPSPGMDSILKGELPKIIMEKVLPNLGESLKKRLADLLRK